MLARYVAGWAAADPAAIAASVADTYRLRDPLLGTFTRRTLPRYFELLRAAFDSVAPTRLGDCGFALLGPMEAPGQEAPASCWREAPALGLSGTTRIVVTPHGIMADVVSYDLNLASDLLRRYSATEEAATVLELAPAA
jgi:hypothetical protein